jgi:hypothetical protein
VLKEKGAPASTIEANTKTIFTFSDQSVVTLVNDRVTQVTQSPPVAPARSELWSVPAANTERRRVVLSIGVGVLAAAIMFRMIFTSFQDFLECVRFYLQPDWISAFRGELVEDKWGTLKLFVWVTLSATAAIAYYGHSGGSLTSLMELLAHHHS